MNGADWPDELPLLTFTCVSCGATFETECPNDLWCGRCIVDNARREAANQAEEDRVRIQEVHQARYTAAVLAVLTLGGNAQYAELHAAAAAVEHSRRCEILAGLRLVLEAGDVVRPLLVGLFDLDAAGRARGRLALARLYR